MSGGRTDAGIDDVEALARAALALWGVTDHPPELIARRENVVFRVRTATGSPAVLRIHRLGYHDDATLRSELEWMAMLRAGGLDVPEPIPASDGALLLHVHTSALPDPRQVDMLSWLDGRPLGRSGAALALDRGALQTVFFDLGAAASRLHTLADGWTRPPGFSRPAWDLDGLVGPHPFWARFWELDELTGDQRRLIECARDAAREDLAAYAASGGSYGLIHADLVRENVLVTGDGVQLIDFDDAGFGWRMFEIATMLCKNRHEPDYDVIERAVLDGYRRHRTLQDADFAALPLFMLLRCLTYLGWAQTRRTAEAAHPRTAAFVTDACEIATAYLGDGTRG